MSHPGKVSFLSPDGYTYWSGIMRAYMQSQVEGIWDISQNETFAVLSVAGRTTPALVAQHEANFKAVNIIFSGLGPSEYERVSHLTIAREIWSLLKAHHEGTATIKAWLVETYRREYENFMQKSGESVDDLFGRFQLIINKIRVNTAPAELPYSDHQQAVKLLYSLDPRVWEIKVNSILESAGYDDQKVEELYSKLKATEVDQQLRATLTGSGSKSLALATTSRESGADLVLHSISFSTLMSLIDERLASFGDEELCLVSSRFQRAYDNRMNKKRGDKPCFECGEIGHFIADCPKKNQDNYKKGRHFSRDSDKHHSGKKHAKFRPSKRKDFRKAFKSYRKDNYKRDKAFFAEIGLYSDGSASPMSSSSSSSSSSEEEI